MNKHMFTKLIALAFVGCFQIAQAAIPSLTVKLPGNTSVYTTSVGAVFDADVYIDSVADFALFDFGLTYDSAKLQALSLTSASVFGAANTETYASSIAPGLVHFAETISGTSPLTEGLNITALTLLGTVHFKALGTGLNNVLNITDPIISDWNANSLAGTLQGANITINPAAVPLPASALLFAPGLLAMFGVSKNKARKLAV